MLSTNVFYQELSPVIAKYKNDLDTFADGTSSSKVSLWRWMNKTNKKFPDPNKLVSVLSKECGLKRIKDIAGHYGGEIENFLRRSFPASFEEFVVDYDDNIVERISDFYEFTIFTICGTDRGATEKELINVIGNLIVRKSGIPQKDITQELINAHGVIAKNKIKDLVRKEIIELRDDESYHRIQKNLFIDIPTGQKYMPKIMNGFLKPEEFEKGYNSINYYSCCISPELANELAKDTKEFFIKCHKKMDADSRKDGIPYIIINFAERLWFDDLDPATDGEVQ